MAKFSFNSNGVCRIAGDAGDNPKLGAKRLSDGRLSLFLEYYEGRHAVTGADGHGYVKGRQRRESLGIYVPEMPRTAEERAAYRNGMETARRLFFEAQQGRMRSERGYDTRAAEGDIIIFMRRYVETEAKRDVRRLRYALLAFVDFLTDPTGRSVPDPHDSKAVLREAMERREAALESMRLPAARLDRALVRRFADYLLERFTGQGPHTALGRFKRLVRVAVEAGVLPHDPCSGVRIAVDNGAITKDTLTMEEVRTLWATHYAGENADIRRGFMFSLLTGVRWCDVRELRYGNVDRSARALRFVQRKTEGHSAAASVVIPLSDTLLELIGMGGREALIFPLPSHSMCLKALRRWTARAGIDKHITWHCARHSFAVNILSRGADIKTVASLLGHSSLQHTEKYTRAVDALRRTAVESLHLEE